MTVVITYLADDNARNRRRARRQAQREQAMQEQRLTRKIALKLSGCVRADKAASLGSLRCKKAEEVERKQNRIYYRKPRSEMGVTCSGRQKQRGKSIPAYYDLGEPCSRKSNADFTKKVDIHAICQNATQQNGVSTIGVTG